MSQAVVLGADISGHTAAAFLRRWLKGVYKMDAYWRAANYLSVGQMYLHNNPLLKWPLTLADGKHMLLGHRGPTARGRSRTL